MFRLTVDSGDALARLFGPVASAGVRLNGRGASSGRRENVRPNPTPVRLRRRRKIAYSDGLIPSRRRHCESGFVRRSKQMVDDKSRLHSLTRIGQFSMSDNACSIKGNVKKNTFPSTGSGETFLDFQPLCARRGARLLLSPPVAFGFALFHLNSWIFIISSDDADGFLKLGKRCG